MVSIAFAKVASINLFPNAVYRTRINFYCFTFQKNFFVKYNNLDIKNWKESDINVDSLWIIDQRDKSGKHSNIYHGNFIPQIPNQLVRRYTKPKEVVIDTFLGSGTTLFECEKLNRKFIGFDINDNIIEFVKDKMSSSTESFSKDYFIDKCDVSNTTTFNKKIAKAYKHLGVVSFQYAILHPPYMDIVKFTDKKEDLSQLNDSNIFIASFLKVVANMYQHLDSERYFSIVIGDVYKNGEVIPLSSLIINAIKQNFKVKLKGIVIKNIEGNRGKLGKGGIWRYRALNSDYYIFKHEYILTFKKI